MLVCIDPHGAITVTIKHASEPGQVVHRCASKEPWKLCFSLVGVLCNLSWSVVSWLGSIIKLMIISHMKMNEIVS